MSDQSQGPGWWLASDGKWYPPQSAPAPPVSLPPQRSTNGLAVASMVLGIVWLWAVGSILALVFGYKARKEIDESGGTQQGRGMAVAGIVLGYVGIGVLLLFAFFIIAVQELGNEESSSFNSTGDTIGPAKGGDSGESWWSPGSIGRDAVVYELSQTLQRDGGLSAEAADCYAEIIVDEVGVDALEGVDLSVDEPPPELQDDISTAATRASTECNMSSVGG